MPIQVVCGECEKRLSVKDELAGKRVRCPGCGQPLRIPAAQEPDDWDVEDYDEPPARSTGGARLKSASGKRSAPSGSSRGTASPQAWKARFKAQWHWVTAGVVLVLAFLFPKGGLIIAGLVMAAGIVMVLVGGLAPLFMIIAKDPGTVLLMIVSRSARFDMMRQPENHPYKQLLRNTGTGYRKWLWRGLLLVVTFIPAAVLSANSPMGKGGGGGNAVPEHAFGPGFRPPGFDRPEHRHPGMEHPGIERPEMPGPRGFQPQRR